MVFLNFRFVMFIKTSLSLPTIIFIHDIFLLSHLKLYNLLN